MLAAGLAAAVWCAAPPNVSAGQGPQLIVELTGGGTAELRREAERLLVTVRGPRVGLASLCVAGRNGTEVRILHASAAVGEASYTRADATWKLDSPFDFKLRETGGVPPSEQDRLAFLTSYGWVANADNTGRSPRNFTIQISSGVQALGVTFVTTDKSMTIAYWPASMDDDCRAVKVAQGFLPPTATFRPAGWHQVR